MKKGNVVIPCLVLLMLIATLVAGTMTNAAPKKGQGGDVIQNNALEGTQTRVW